jgi:hypothetical protein
MEKPSSRSRRMAGKRNSLGRNEFLFSGRRIQVAIPEANLGILKNGPRDQKELRSKPVGSLGAFIPITPYSH